MMIMNEPLEDEYVYDAKKRILGKLYDKRNLMT